MAKSSQFIGWYYVRNGQRVGPITSEELVALIDQERLDLRAKVWKAWKDGPEVRYYESQAGAVVGRSSGVIPKE